MDIWTALSVVAILGLIVVLWTRRPRERSFTVAIPEPVEEQLAGFTARNGELVGVLRERGVDLNTPRQIDLHFLANTEESAKTLMRSLGSAFPGGTLQLERAKSIGPPWSVTCVVQAAGSAIVQPLAVERRIRLATSAGAIHDGWGTPVEKR